MSVALQTRSERMRGSMSQKGRRVITVQFPHFPRMYVHQGNYMNLVLYSSVVSLKEDRQLRITCRNSCQIVNIGVCPFIQYILVVGSLEHIHIANVPAQGPTSNVFMLPRAFSMVLEYSLTRTVYAMGINIICHGCVSGFTNQGK